MADLGTLANLAEIFGAATVAGGVAFAVLQIRHLRAQRMETAAIELVRSFQSPEFVRAVRIVWELPDGLDAEALVARGPEVEEAAITVGSVFETLGVMVFHRIAPLAIVQDLMGGTVQVAWRKLRPYAEATRREAGFEKPYEWFQWLAERLEEALGPAQAAGAHVTHKAWQP